MESWMNTDWERDNYLEATEV